MNKHSVLLLFTLLWVVCFFVLVYCCLGLLTCKNRLPYNLYCVGGDVKHCSIQFRVVYLTASDRLASWLTTSCVVRRYDSVTVTCISQTTCLLLCVPQAATPSFASCQQHLHVIAYSWWRMIEFVVVLTECTWSKAVIQSSWLNCGTCMPRQANHRMTGQVSFTATSFAQ